eukprot:2860467-Pleurochrysis_carterae.AAC.2
MSGRDWRKPHGCRRLSNDEGRGGGPRATAESAGVESRLNGNARHPNKQIKSADHGEGCANAWTEVCRD